MELTNVLGQAFQVNLDSIVYAVARGSGATLLLSKGGVTVEVEETVAEVVTASGDGMTSFTASAGDVTGTVAINPNYILTVSSVDGGDSSLLVVADNTATRLTVTVDTDYSAMDAIIEAASGGASYLVYTALLTQADTDAPVATVLENTLGGTVVWSYSAVGIYLATLSGAFTANKTWCSVTCTWAGSDYMAQLARINANAVRLFVEVDGDGTLADDWAGVSVEIRVYP